MDEASRRPPNGHEHCHQLKQSEDFYFISYIFLTLKPFSNDFASPFLLPD